MHVAVCIVGFNNVDDISACLVALERSRHTDFTVIICENGGANAYERLRDRLPTELSGGQSVSIKLAPSNLGFAGGVNVCLASTPDADAWWLLNPDTQPEPAALDEMIQRLDRGDCDAVGCVVYKGDNSVQAYGGLWRPWLARTVALGVGRPLDATIDAAAVERRQNFVMGASMLVNRRFVATAGPMREDYFLYAEETEWCMRALRKGLRLGFAPLARVLHGHGTTTGAGEQVNRLPRLPVYLNERNKMLLTADLFPGRLPVAALSALVLIALRFARRGAWRQVGFALNGWLAGVKGLRGPPPWLAV